MRVAIGLLCSVLLLTGCADSKSATPAGPVVLKGRGATAPYLIYAKWVTAFKKDEPNIDLQYQATGSGDGIRQLEIGGVDFAATDIPLTDAEAAKLSVKPYHFPTLIGAIVAVYNLSELNKDLQLNGPVLAAVLSGKITRWNDPALTKINAGAPLPATKITVIHRSD